MYVLNSCECEIGYKCCNEKRAGFDYTIDLFKFMNQISEQILVLGVNIRDENVVERLQQVKFLNENGNFVIIDGDEKTVVGKILDDEFLVQINGAWNEYLLFFVTDFWKIQQLLREEERIGEEEFSRKYPEQVKPMGGLYGYDIMREVDKALDELKDF